MLMPVADGSVIARKPRIVGRLLSVLPPDAVIHDETETRAYECDALTAYRCPPLAVVLPSSTEEVAAVLRICHEEGVPVADVRVRAVLPGEVDPRDQFGGATASTDARGGCGWRLNLRTCASFDAHFRK